MPVDMNGVTTVAVAAERAADFARRAFVAVGLPEDDARKAAVALVDADLHGVSTHGIKNLDTYVRAVQSGRANPKPNVRVTSSGAAIKQMSGDGGLGHVVSHYGMEAAIALAKHYGIGCVFMRESNHYGASGYWARLAVKHDMAGFAVTNAGAGMAPWGGKVPLMGNNPPSWAVPARLFGAAGDSTAGDGTAENGQAGALTVDGAVFLDMALSAVAGNRLDIYRRRGQPVPLGWALDKAGQPTTDPRARANGGSLAPIAGYKGFGLAMMLSLFTSLLSDGPFDYDQNRTDVPRPGRCHWFMALDIAQLVPLETFTARVHDVAERVRTSPPAAGVDQVYAPGDVENAFARRQLETGIQYESFVLDDLRALAASLGITHDLV
ncbi:MAG: Ldh family oxidoreductase [Chloroflexi bacterium]|nr:Ldh family oxidoreductase [Chloroflexota bacterium]